MKLVYGISRWTNPYRSAARHIDDGTGKPLCGGMSRRAYWETDEGNPTYERCKKLYQKIEDKLHEKMS